jgi:hypothetical protein
MEAGLQSNGDCISNPMSEDDMRDRKFQWFVLFGAILLAPLFMLATTPYAFGCDTVSATSMAQCAAQIQAPSTNTPTPTTTVTDTTTITLTATITPTATPRPTWTPAPTPVGDSPDTARDPIYIRPDNCIDAMCPEQKGAPALTAAESWTWIGANSSTWYKMDDGHSFQLKVWVFANRQQGLSMDVFAPEQRNHLWDAKPIGRGSFDKSQANAGVDLFYSGRSSAYGVWYVRLNNVNAYPVSYSIRFTRTIPQLGNVCDSCHALIGTDWGSCQGDMCANLHALYDTNPQCYNHDVNTDLAGGCQ